MGGFNLRVKVWLVGWLAAAQARYAPCYVERGGEGVTPANVERGGVTPAWAVWGIHLADTRL